MSLGLLFNLSRWCRLRKKKILSERLQNGANRSDKAEMIGRTTYSNELLTKLTELTELPKTRHKQKKTTTNKSKKKELKIQKPFYT